MKLFKLIFLFTAVIFNTHLYSQDEFLYTSDGVALLRQRQLVQNCLDNLNKTKNDKAALAVCRCQVSLLNRQFTYKQFKKYMNEEGLINISSLLKENPTVNRAIEYCYKRSGQATLLIAVGDGNGFISNCMQTIQKNTEKKLDYTKLKSFCSCQLQLIKSKEITDAELESVQNPNSLLFYEMIYKCGNPFVKQEDDLKNWSAKSANDLRGPDVDTVSILNLNGMTYVKLKIGSLIQIWLFDTGASDLLITTDMEKTLRDEKIITDSSYLGIGEYEMANGAIDSCKKYNVNNIRIGNFFVDNVTVAVSTKGKRIIAGKALLNKFIKWSLNNEQSKLILWK